MSYGNKSILAKTHHPERQSIFRGDMVEVDIEAIFRRVDTTQREYHYL